jgi:hypothetical protein
VRRITPYHEFLIFYNFFLTELGCYDILFVFGGIYWLNAFTGFQKYSILAGM